MRKVNSYPKPPPLELEAAIGVTVSFPSTFSIKHFKCFQIRKKKEFSYFFYKFF